MAAPVVFAAVAMFRLPHAGTRPRRIALLSVAVLVTTLAAAQVLEGIGAFGSGVGIVNKLLETSHVLGEAGTLFSVFALPLAIAILVILYASAAIRAFVRR